MIAVVQRVTRARVDATGADGARARAEIGRGLVALVCAVRGDGAREARWIADKIAALRVFPDDAGKMNRSVRDEAGGVLVVSQFTLAGELKKGTRPSFTRAAAPEIAEPLVDCVARRLREEHDLAVGTGVFGASMRVELVNDGPVTIILDRPPTKDDESINTSIAPGARNCE